MQRFYHAKRITLAVSCLVLGVCAPALDEVADVVLDGGHDVIGDAIPDVPAEVTIPPECNCEEPLRELDERLSALEAKPAPGTFGMRVSTNGGPPHQLLVPGSHAGAYRSVRDVSTTGALEWSAWVSVSGIDPTSRTQFSAAFILAEPFGVGVSIPLGVREAWSESGLGDHPEANRCTASPAAGAGTIDGTITFSRADERLVGTFTMSVTCSDGTGTRVVTAGTIDVPYPAVPTTGAYVP